MNKNKQISDLVDEFISGISTREQLIDFLIVISNDVKYKEGQSGALAKKYNKIVGALGCKYCGHTVHGFISENVYDNICPECGKPFFIC